MILFEHNGKVALERDPLVVEFSDQSERNYTVAELVAENGSAADLGDVVSIAGKAGIVIQDPTAKYYKDVTLSVPATVVDSGNILVAPTGVITTASGTTGVPAVITLAGTFFAGTKIDVLVETDVPSANYAPYTFPATVTAANAAIEYAAYLSGIDNFTASANVETIECLALGLATTCDLSQLVVTLPTP